MITMQRAEKTLTIDEVARLLSMSTEAVHNFIDTKQLAAVGDDGTFFFTQSSIETFILSLFSELDDINDDDHF